MNLFKKSKSAGQASAFWLLRLRALAERRQRQAADWLSRKTAYWSKASWLIALLVFSLLFGGCCLLLCIKAFIH